MLKLKLQYFDHFMQRDESLEKTLVLGKIRQKEKELAEDERAHSIDSMAMTLSKLWETVSEDRGPRCSAVHGVTMRLRG